MSIGIVILNGAPRAGKSSIAREMQASLPGIWMNLGVDAVRSMTPEAHQPGMGLRPGAHASNIQALLPACYEALYGSVVAYRRAGFKVVVDVCHYDQAILESCLQQLGDLPRLFVGVRCPVEIIMARRAATGWEVAFGPEGSVPEPVALWQDQVHGCWAYDFEVDTSLMSVEECVEAIRARLG